MSTDRATGQSTRRSRECAELIGVMREQERICTRLLEISTQERVVVVEGRLDDLERSTREKGGLIEQMDRLEQRRRELAEQLALDLALPVDTSLAGLAVKVAGREGDDLLEVRLRVAEAVARLRESNESNLLLMRKSLELVRDSMRQLRRSTGSGEVYTADGRPTVGVRGNLAVDCRA